MVLENMKKNIVMIQEELSKERAECIANKYNSLVEEKTKVALANHKYASQCEDKVIVLQNNWNELKKWLEDYIKATEEDYKQTSTEECIKTQKTIIAVSKNMLREMQELEQGKDG